MTTISRELKIVDGRIFRISIIADDTAGTPWENEDGHGPVSDFTQRPKRPGELYVSGIFQRNRPWARFYDFQEACKIARRDGWGVSPHSEHVETGANGLRRVHAHHFEGRELRLFVSDWHDDINAAYRQVYAAHKATMTPRQYAAMAARQDFERLKAWCDGEWHYVGVAVERLADDETVDATESLWGIESDAGPYLQEVAAELIDQLKPGKES